MKEKKGSSTWNLINIGFHPTRSIYIGQTGKPSS